MQNKVWGYIRYLIFGILSATTLLWSFSVAPAVAGTFQSPPNPIGTFDVLPLLRGGLRPGVTTDPEGAEGMTLSLPFRVDSQWESVSPETTGITWQITPLIPSESATTPPTPPLIKGRQGGDEIRFAIQDGKFVAGKEDTWFVYGWFGALEAIKQPYNIKYLEWKDRHNGIDFAGKTGLDIVSASTGKVIFAGWKIGKTVVVDAGKGYRITYGHLQDIAVKKGERVGIGDSIGHLGNTGTVNPHLHFQIDQITKTGRVAINPVPLLDTDWSKAIIPTAEANQFYTAEQDPLLQPNFVW